MTLAYPAKLTKEPEGGFTVAFRDVPGAITYGRTMTEALEMARDALTAILTDHTIALQPLPEPSKPQRGESMVALKALKGSAGQAGRPIRPR